MFGIYIHIPFCTRRCPFCDFTLTTDTSADLIDNYVRALCIEIQRRKPQSSPVSIYFGGGTPSLLSEKNLHSILEALHENFIPTYLTEITLETNPEDANSESAKMWKNLGISRISLGVQTLNDHELERLGRNHRSKDVETAFEKLYAAGLTNISVDLMFGLESQTIASWEETLKKTLDVRPKHISTYNLTIEKNTMYDREHAEGKLNLPSDEIQADMLVHTKQIFHQNGYDPYEISNAAIPGFESKHNMLYWTGKPYLGFGVSAHSFENENGNYRRYWNTKNIPLYIKSIKNGVSVVDNEEILDAKTHLRERLMTGLRLRKGINIDLLEKEGLSLPSEMKKQMDELIKIGMLDKNGPILSIPMEQIPITNEILLRLFS